MAKVINLPYPHALQKKILLDPARFKVINLGRRTGKSALVADKAKYTSLETGYNSLIISDTLTHAREIYWDEILPKAIPEQWATKNENLNTIKFRPQAYNLPIKEFWGRDINVDYSGSAHTPIIRLKGIDDNPDKLRGGKYGFIAVDEAAFANCDLNEVYDKILRPMVADTGGEIWIISTPDGVMNHFFTFATLAQNNLEPDWAYFHGTALDNPYFDPKGLGEWESIKRSYERKGKINEWKQEYMGEFSQPESMVFPTFDPDVHILRPDDIPDLEKMNHFIGMDFGWNDPFAVVFIAVEPRTNTWYIYDEIYEQHTSTDDKVMLMKPKMAGTYYNYIVGDTADPTEIENLKRKGIKVRPAKKSHDLNKAGISEIRGQMQLRELDAKPRLYISARCRNMINEVMGLSYTKNAWGELTDVIDPRMPDHLVDALKYISHYMSNGGTPPPKAKKSYSATGRLLT